MTDNTDLNDFDTEVDHFDTPTPRTDKMDKEMCELGEESHEWANFAALLERESVECQKVLSDMMGHARQQLTLCNNLRTKLENMGKQYRWQIVEESI